VLRHNPEWVVERGRLSPYFDAPPDKTLALVAEMDLGVPTGRVVYACPMHPEITSDQPDRCPKCGMKLVAVAAATYVCPMHPEVVSDKPGHCPKCGMTLVPADVVTQASTLGPTSAQHAQHGGQGHGDHAGEEVARDGHAHDPTPVAQHDRGNEQYGHDRSAAHAGQADSSPYFHHGHEQSGRADRIEWEDDMVDVNRMMTPATMRWSFVDRDTGAVGHAIDWQFRVGDKVKLRVINEMDSDHPMHHPFHIHGAGRFVVT
jgi:hypothetical protein